MRIIQAAHISTNNTKDPDTDIDIMIFDSGASCSAFPREVGEGYGIVQDEHAAYEYHGSGSENSAITDEGRR